MGKAYTDPSPFGERFTRRGEVMVTRQQLALLEALYDAPHHTFRSITEWVDATVPRLQPTNADKLWRSVARVPGIWVSRTRVGRRKVCALQARGRAIVEGTAPAWLIGDGRIRREPRAVAEPDARSRPSRGQLLDRLDSLYFRLLEASDREAPAVEAKLVEAEAELSALEAERHRNVGGGLDRELLQRCQAAAGADDLQGFLVAAGAVSAASRSEVVRLMYRFPHWWQRFLALEEIVLGAEVERYGVELAGRRRRSYREAGLRILRSRLEVLA